MTVTVIHGDCTAVLPTLAAGSVQCCVTSPPYVGLRAYPHAPTAWPDITFVPVAGLPDLTVPAQVCHVGAEADPWSSIAHIVHVFRAVWRVLRPDGTLWLNLGDSYAARRSYQVSPTRWPALVFDDRNAGPLPPGLKAKDLLLIPSRVALALQADGWWLRNDVIWEKPNAMPESVRDRLTTSYEHILICARRDRYSYDAAALAEPATVGHRGSRFTTGKTRAAREQIGAPVGQRDRVERGTRNARDVWQISTRSYHGAHMAVFPEDLPARCIQAGSAPQWAPACGAPWQRGGARGAPDPLCPPGLGAQGDWQPTCTCPDTTGGGRSLVLDPFGGSGTTGAVAERLGRGGRLDQAAAAYLPLIAQRTDQRPVPQRPPPPPPRRDGPVSEEETR